jgi:undecaprenyl diphosphate synthase
MRSNLIPSRMVDERLHMGLIMDGNRRFAKRLMLEPWKGHEFGVDALERALEWCKQNAIGTLTVYAFSMQNFNRPKHEFDYLMNIARKQFERYLSDEDNTVDKNSVKMRFIGRIDLFPEDIQKLCRDLEKKTAQYSGYTFNICLGYGGREEIVDAVHRIANDIKDEKISPSQVDESLLDSYVYLSSKPDFIIRTGGDRRTSNFLLWQSAYSEWFFLDKFFPELKEEDLDAVLAEFKQRDRRFGK